MRSPVDTFHTPIFLLLDPEAKYSPFGENTTLLILQEELCILFLCSLVNVHVLLKIPLKYPDPTCI